MAFIGTTDILTSGSSFTSGRKEAERYDTVAGTVLASHSGTLHVEQSSDGTNWDVDTSYTIAANDGKGFQEALVAPYWRLRYVNDGTNQTTFRLFARTNESGLAT